MRENADQNNSEYGQFSRSDEHKTTAKLNGNYQQGILFKTNYLLIKDLPNAMNNIRVLIASVNKIYLKDIANTLNNKLLHLPSHSKYKQRYRAASNAIISTLFKFEISEKIIQKPPVKICHIKFL